MSAGDEWWGYGWPKHRGAVLFFSDGTLDEFFTPKGDCVKTSSMTKQEDGTWRTEGCGHKLYYEVIRDKDGNVLARIDEAELIREVGRVGQDLPEVCTEQYPAQSYAGDKIWESLTSRDVLRRNTSRITNSSPPRFAFTHESWARIGPEVRQHFRLVEPDACRWRNHEN